MPDPLVADARVPLADPRGMLQRLCAHFAGRATVTYSGGAQGRLDSPLGTALLTAEADVLVLHAECPDEAALYVVKSALSEHIFQLAAGEEPAFAWTGSRTGEGTIPFLQAMTVVSACDLTPRMRRVTLTGPNVERYLTGHGLHVRLLLPPKGRIPVWPTLGADGRVRWPQGEDTLAARLYTIRRVDTERRTVDVDVVLHDGNHTPGAAWGAGAQIGEVVGLMGPGGGRIPEAAHYLLGGDETGLPAALRVAESLQEGARATLLIEVADRAEEQPLASAAALDIIWLHRNGAAAGTTSLLIDALRAFDWTEAGEDIFVMIGCEHATARTIRTFLRKERGLAKNRHLVAAYWRRGYTSGEAEDPD